MWESLLDTVQAVAVWVITAFITAVACWMGWVTKMVVASRTRIHVLEENVRGLPAKAQEIKDTLRDMRAENLDARDEASVARERIHGKIEGLRLELKQDIKDAKTDIKEVAAIQIEAGLIAAAAQLKAGFDEQKHQE